MAYWLITLMTASTPGKVYIVPGSDTSVWGGLNTNNLYNSFNNNDPVYCNQTGAMSHAMDSSYRLGYLDSLGHPVKFTWWVQGGSLYNNSLNHTGSWLTLDLMRENHYAAITSWGDEISYHYHTWAWFDLDEDGIFHWNQATTFEQTREDFDITLGKMILDERIYPASFRSGWNTMDTPWENRLDEIIPYRLDNWPGAYRQDTTEPTDNIYDWRGSPTYWHPYHPSTSDFKQEGTQKGWETRHQFMTNVSQANWNQIFADAEAGADQLVCIWSHIPDVEFFNQFSTAHARITTAQAAYPGVEFEYCTALEAYQKWLKLADTASPQLQLALEKNGETRILHLQASEPIYQDSPVIATKTRDWVYGLITAFRDSSESWYYSYNRLTQDINSTGWGVSDMAGNPSVIVGAIDNSYRDRLPSLQISVPCGTLFEGDTSILIGYQVSTGLRPVRLSLYYSESSIGLKGSLVEGDIPVDSTYGYYLWNTLLMPNGNYYIYGLAEDGYNLPILAYGDNSIRIRHGTLDGLPPDAPANLRITGNNQGDITLAWDTPTPASDGDYPVSYLVYRGDSSSLNVSEYPLLTSFGARGSENEFTVFWTDHSLGQPTTVYYALAGVDDNGNLSQRSNGIEAVTADFDKIPPCPVTDLSQGTSDYGEVALKWTLPEAAEDGDFPSAYVLHRGMNSGFDDTHPQYTLATVDGSQLRWVDSSLDSSSTGYYVLTSLDEAGNESMPSNELAAQPRTEDLIIDNRDPECLRVLGTWAVGSTTPIFIGSDYFFIGTHTTSMTGLVEFRPEIPVAGYYNVYAWYTQGTNRPVDGLYQVYHRNGMTEIRLDQTQQGSQWNELGRYYFFPGTGGYVNVGNYCPQSPGKYIIVDAIRFALDSPSPTHIDNWGLYKDDE